MGTYIGTPYLAALNAKNEEEYEQHKAEYQRRIQEYKEKGLSIEQEPDGSYDPSMLDGTY
jgi:hypothetical protein